MKKYLLLFFGAISAFLLLALSSPKLKAQTISSTIGSAVGCVGDTITVPVSVNMTAGTSVSAISMTIGFDSTKLECLGGAQNLISSLSGSLSNCAIVPGVGKQVRFVWTSPNLIPISINSQIFELKFKVLVGGSHIINWDLTPGQCEYADQFAQVIPNSAWLFGTVSCNSSPINVSLGSANGCSGDTLSIPVSILNANNIGAISLALNYNPNSTTFLGVTGIEPMISTLIASTNNFGGFNQIRASWAEVTPVNLNGIAFYIRVIVNN
ncbi:MAG: cohesin domain-containing protein, partial [Bacteroidota bacterium]